MVKGSGGKNPNSVEGYRKRTMSDIKDESQQVSSAQSFISVPCGKKSKATNSVVMAPLNSILPVAVPGTTGELAKTTMSAPCSPVNEQKKSKLKVLRKFFPRPSSPTRKKRNGSTSEDPGSDHGNRPKSLPVAGGWMRKRRAKSVDAALNGATTIFMDGSGATSPMGSLEVLGLHSTSSSSLGIEPEATPVATLPGQKLERNNHEGELHIPTIMVSHTGDDYEQNDNGDLIRKMSQSSHCSSTLHSGTSGVGSLLSTGDECDPTSDLETPLTPMSPLSAISSDHGSTEELRCDLGALSDTDYIEKDCVTSPSSDSETLGVITPPPLRESPPPDAGSGSESTEGTKVGKKKRDRPSRPWDRVKKYVQAWSPFTLQFVKKRYPWVQLAGHQGNFAPGAEGAIMKKSDDNEHHALRALMSDSLRPFVPEFKRVVERDGDMYVEMTDLLREFDEPAVMDIKMGIRTYLEEELIKARTKKTLRKDMYEKMIAVDPNEPTPEEHAQMAITKPRYMQWRESMSSTSTLGFRIEGIKTSSANSIKDFKTTRMREDVIKALRCYLLENTTVKEPFLQRLKDIRSALESSPFFSSHEVIGSSLLFVYDSSNQSSIHMIDFGKTTGLPPNVSVDHRSTWVEGNHEDGYLWGLDNLIEIWEDL